MSNPQKILVAYDGSPHSKAALSWALLLSSDENVELDVIKVFEPINLYFDFSVKLVERYSQLEKEDRQMMEEVKSFCERCGKTKVYAEVLKGHVASTLLDYARQAGVDLIVTGTKGHGALEEMLMGSVTSSLASLSKVPVLIVKEQEAPTRLQNILVAYDDSDSSKAALDLAIDIGKLVNAKILAVKVADSKAFAVIDSISGSDSGSAAKLKSLLDELSETEIKLMDEAKAAAALKGTAIATELLPTGNVADSILKYAAKMNSDLIVAGTLGHGFLEGVLIGSVTRNLISLSQLPVLVVKSKKNHPVLSDIP